jgi:predicted transcriptional regulator
MPEFDRFKFPAIFAELEGSSALITFVNFLEQLQDECGIDPNSSRLANRAQSYARFHDVSFGEALDQVQKRQMQNAASSKAVEAGLPGARLSELAYQVMRSRGVSFGEALAEVAAENPKLTVEINFGEASNPAARVSQAQRAVESDSSDKAVKTGALSAKLNALAWERVKSTGATFKQALFEVAAEHPELTGLDTQRFD